MTHLKDVFNSYITALYFRVTIDKAGSYKCEAVYFVGGQSITRTSTTAKLFVRGMLKYYVVVDSLISFFWLIFGNF